MARAIQFPDQGLNLGPWHWECGDLATGPVGKSPDVSIFTVLLGFTGGSDGKESACNVGDPGSISKNPLEKGMATHPSILAWKIPLTEEPGVALVHGVANSQR